MTFNLQLAINLLSSWMNIKLPINNNCFDDLIYFLTINNWQVVPVEKTQESHLYDVHETILENFENININSFKLISTYNLESIRLEDYPYIGLSSRGNIPHISVYQYGKDLLDKFAFYEEDVTIYGYLIKKDANNVSCKYGFKKLPNILSNPNMEIVKHFEQNTAIFRPAINLKLNDLNFIDSIQEKYNCYLTTPYIAAKRSIPGIIITKDNLLLTDRLKFNSTLYTKALHFIYVKDYPLTVRGRVYSKSKSLALGQIFYFYSDQEDKQYDVIPPADLLMSNSKHKANLNEKEIIWKGEKLTYSLNFYSEIDPKCYFCHKPLDKLCDEYKKHDYLRFRQGYERGELAFGSVLTSILSKKQICTKYWKKLSNKPYKTCARLRSWLKINLNVVKPQNIRKMISKYNLSLEKQVLADAYKSHKVLKLESKKLANDYNKIKPKLKVQYKSEYNEKVEQIRSEKSSYGVPDIFHLNKIVETKNKISLDLSSNKLNELTIDDLYTMYCFYCSKRKRRFKRETVSLKAFKDYLSGRNQCPKRLLQLMCVFRKIHYKKYHFTDREIKKLRAFNPDFRQELNLNKTIISPTTFYLPLNELSTGPFQHFDLHYNLRKIFRERRRFAEFYKKIKSKFKPDNAKVVVSDSRHFFDMFDKSNKSVYNSALANIKNYKELHDKYLKKETIKLSDIVLHDDFFEENPPYCYEDLDIEVVY
jgi:hypothetical protein